MLTALGVSNSAAGNGARKLLQVEVVAPTIRPAGAITSSSLNVPGSTIIPPMAVDGRVHTMDGNLAKNPDGTVATVKGCSAISALATDSGSTQLEQGLNQIRLNIVNTANASCTSSGGSISPNTCTPGLAWVRGTSSSPRFSTGSSTSGSNTSGSDGGSNSGPDGGSSSGSDGHDDGSKSNGSSSAIYTTLDLSAPQLYGLPSTSTVAGPFIGNPGNQSDPTLYQPPGTQTVGDEISAVKNLVLASQGQANYFSISPAGLGMNNSFGSSDPSNPVAAIVVDATTDSSTAFTVPANTVLTGTGVLVITNALEVYGTLRWNGIVLVKSAAGHVTIAQGAQGAINGALLLAPGATFNFPGGSLPSGQSPSFTVNYSCDAIDLPFKSLPFKVVAAAEGSN